MKSFDTEHIKKVLVEIQIGTKRELGSVCGTAVTVPVITRCLPLNGTKIPPAET
jgi:hypothetical protein